MSTNSHKALTFPLSCRSRRVFSTLYSTLLYSLLCSSLPLRSTHLATIEPSYSSCCQFDSQAVSSLLDMDLDSFSASTRASAVTQVDDLWHGRRACRETFHCKKCQASQEIPCLIQNGFRFTLWYLTPTWRIISNAEYSNCCLYLDILKPLVQFWIHIEVAW